MTRRPEEATEKAWWLKQGATADRSRSKSELFHLAVQPWADQLTTLCFSFPTSEEQASSSMRLNFGIYTEFHVFIRIDEKNIKDSG